MQLLKRMLLLTWLVMLPASVYAQQATITGVVKDASGAVLPGVTVEASSEVLIEKVRSATTDGTGQYRIVDLARYLCRNVHASRFQYSQARRHRTDGTFVASVNAELKVGQVTETIR